MGTDKNAEFLEQEFFSKKHQEQLEKYLYDMEQRYSDMEIPQWMAIYY